MASAPPFTAKPERARRCGLFRRVFGFLWRFVLCFILLSVAMVVLYRFVPPPITLTMIGDALGGHSIH